MPRQYFQLNARYKCLKKIRRFEHPPRPRFATGLIAIIGAPNTDSILAELGDVSLRCWVLPHLTVHRRSNV